jgi:hypothetical protein
VRRMRLRSKRDLRLSISGENRPFERETGVTGVTTRASVRFKGTGGCDRGDRGRLMIVPVTSCLLCCHTLKPSLSLRVTPVTPVTLERAIGLRRKLEPDIGECPRPRRSPPWCARATREHPKQQATSKELLRLFC